MNKVAMIIETRQHKALEFVLHNVLNILPIDWKIQIFHGTNNLDYIKALDIDMDRIILSNLGMKTLPQWPQSNDLMITEDLWNRVEGDTILYFEADTMLLPNSKYTISDFEHYDFIGGYWGKQRYDMIERYPVVMNGGISIRNKTFMLKCIREYKDTYLELGGNPCEDYFYSACVDFSQHQPLASDVMKFSIDCGYIVPDEIPLAVHKPWVNKGGAYPKLKQMCPEIEELERLQDV